MSTATTLLPTRTWLCTSSAPTAHWYFIHGTNSGNRCQDSSVSFLSLHPPPLPPCLHPPMVVLQPSNNRSLSGLYALLSLHSLSSSFLFSGFRALSHSSPPCLFPINTFSPICPSVSKTGVTETSRPAPN